MILSQRFDFSGVALSEKATVQEVGLQAQSLSPQTLNPMPSTLNPDP